MAHDGKYIVLDIFNTVNKDDTSYKAEGQYIDSNLIRWDNNRVENYAGWQERALTSAINGVSRDITSWKELRDMPHFAVGTQCKLQIEQLGTLYDITPVETTVATSNIVNTVAGQTSVTISAPSHSREAGDYIILVSVETSIGGLTLSGEYQITSVPTPDAYVINTGTTAAATSASDGGQILIYHLLECGEQSNGTAFGYGAGTYGTYGATSADGWGDPRGGSGIDVALRQWSLDTWGEDLITTVRGGKTYHWDATTSVTTRASALVIPTSTNVSFVHPNRHLVLLGTQPVGTSAIDPLEVRWSDRDNFREFSVSAGTLAGSYRLQGSGNEIVGYVKSKREVLIFTDSAVWSMRPLNNDLVFSFDPLTTGSGLIAQHAAVDVDGRAYWMSYNNFYMYDGQIRVMDNQLTDYVFNDIDRNQKEKTFCGVNKNFEEIMWFYQSNDSTTGDIDKYVKFTWSANGGRGAWDIGEIDRVVWEDVGTFDTPLGVSDTGKVYNQDSGDTYVDAANQKSFIETSYFDIEDGTDMLLFDQFIPDFVLSGAVNLTVYLKKWPNGTEISKGPFSITPTTEKISLRARGRQAKLRFSTSAAGTEWGIGKPRYRIKTDGER